MYMSTHSLDRTSAQEKLKIFLDMIFKDYVSINPITFNLRCEELGKNPDLAKKYLLDNGNIKIIANGHIEFLRYE